MTQQRFVLVGAGIGGPVLALCLRRLGAQVTLLEGRARVEPDEGAFMGLAPNGMHVLRALGVQPAIEHLGHPCSAFSFRNARGQEIGRIDRSGDREALGSPLTMVRRGELHALLAHLAVESGADVRLGQRVVAISESEHGVRVSTESGEVHDADVLVGCDGVHSAVRKLVFPEAPAPRASGLLDYGGFAPFAAPLPPGENVMVFGRRAFFGAFVTQAGETWWFHNGPERADGESPAERLGRLHREDPEWVREIVASTPAILGPWPLTQLPRLPRWVSGRVALLGDAAHAMTPSAGQGASMAMEDAAALARCLVAGEDVSAALRAYERGRRDRVESIAAVASRNDGGKRGSHPVSGWFRDRIFPRVIPTAAAAQTEAYAHREAL